MGGKLLVRFYVVESPWASFSGREQRVIKKTHRAFAEGLRQGGFLPAEGEGGGGISRTSPRTR